MSFKMQGFSSLALSETVRGGGRAEEGGWNDLASSPF